MFKTGVFLFVFCVVNALAKPHERRCLLKDDSILSNQRELLDLVQKMKYETARTLEEIKTSIRFTQIQLDRMEEKQRDIEKTLTRIPGMVSPIFRRIGLGLFYIENRAKLNWTDAEYTCRLSGGHLAVFQTKDEFENVAWALEPSNEYWLGINDRGKWIDYLAEASEKRTPYLRWPLGEPENFKGLQKNCVGMTERKTTDWWPCDSKRNFICRSDDKY